MAESFDPYRDWLGVEGGRPAANHYRLLGLKLFESKRQTILAAAQAAITRVEKTATNEQAVARREVLAAIRAAARCLLDPAARAQYDATLGPLPSAIPVATPLPVATPIKRPGVDLPAPSEPAAVKGALPSSLWDDEGQIPRTLETARPSSSWKASLAVALGFLLASLALAGGYVVWRQGQAPTPPAVSADPAPQPAADVVPPAVASQTADPVSAGVEDETASQAPPQPAPLPVNVPTETLPSANTESIAKADAEKQPSPQFAQALNRVRAALLAREAGLARRRLAQAKRLATSGAQEETVRRLDVLAEQLERFLEAVRRGLSKFTAAEELNVNGQLMSIIAASREAVSLRVEGSQHDYTPATLPAPIALVIAKAGADEDAPPAKVFFGAFFLVESRGDRALARQLWESAAAAGEPVDDLLRLLDADDLAIEREPVPDSAARAKAEKRVAREFAVTIRGARSKEQKDYLVDRLTKAAARADDSADQFALLSEACAQAAMTPDPRRALAIVDELARWFQLERQALKIETLAKAAAASRDVDAAREVALCALTLLDEVGHQSELAKTLAQAAVSAARRSGDAELLKKATVRRRQIERAIRERGKPSVDD